MEGVNRDPWVTQHEAQGSLLNKFMDEVSSGQREFINVAELPARIANVRVGPTPRERIWHRNKASLYHYYLESGAGELVVPGQPYPRIPLLIVYALINKSYILDLRQGNSFIDYMIRRGFDVFLLDWGTPSDEDASLNMDNYLLDYLPRALKKMRQFSGKKDYSMLGYCMGGTMSLIHVAAHPEDQPKNIVMLAAPIDFEQPNTYALWLKEQHFNVDFMVSSLGIVPGEMLDFGAKMLKPFQNYVQSYFDLHGKLWDDKYVESWLAMNKWVNDGIPMPGETFRQWVKEFYRHNKLVKGRFAIGGKYVNLKDVTCNLLNLIAERDHIVPPEMSSTVMELVSSQDKTQYIIPAGHVGMVAGRGAVTTLWPMIADWLQKRSV